MPPPLSAVTLLDLLCRKEVIYNGNMSTEPIFMRVLGFIGFEYALGHDATPAHFATTLMLTCTKYFKLTAKNALFFRWIVLRPPLDAVLPTFERVFGLHSAMLLSLDVSYCHDFITDEKLEALALVSPRLTQCVLWGCHQLTDVGLNALATSCRYLTFLNFGACPLISDAALAAIGAELLYLDNLHMGGCPRVTDVGVASLAPCSRVVLQLHQTPAPYVPMEYDLHHMKTQLRKFDGKKVTYRVMGDGKHELVLHFGSRPKAVKLWVETKPNKFMPRLTTSDGTHHFAGQYVCTSLKVLNLVGCKKATDPAVAARLQGHHIQMKVLR
ncbi:Aste57867_10544 [Aphanomyces stellatus]|uniref:Aste57867_10544 protein n=1 Tax=Aphanomyces stellatus TaxID=120398 RepID=A0A485KRN3_9STRA|nr:hypothetical protein As57867_010504 [Aphanomyces stellatus]VFT87417.1 Aste57867_10544 [Aphanomyces stellatus]